MTYSIDLPVSNIFCFPLYYYPLFVAASFLLFAFIIKVFNALKPIKNVNEPLLDNLMDENKKQILQHFIDYTPLPIDISKKILNEFLGVKKSFILRLWNEKLYIKQKKTKHFIIIYSVIALIMHLINLAIIVTLYVEWQDFGDFDIIHGFGTWSISIMTGCPLFKIINYGYSLYALNIDQDKSVTFSWKLFPFFIPHILVFILVGLWLIIYVYMISFFYYLPVYVGMMICMAYCPKLLWILDDAWTKFQWTYRKIRIGAVALCFFYVFTVYMLVAMVCVYSGEVKPDRYYKCLLEGFKSPYCPNFTVNIDDWRGIILLISWILF